MTGRVEVLMSAKDAEMVAAWQRARNSITAFQGDLSALDGKHKAIELSGRRVWESTRTPLEKFKAEVAGLADLYKKGAIDQETYSRAIAKANDTLAKTETQTVKVDAAQQALEASGKKVFESTRTPLEKYNSQLGELDRLLKAGTIDQETYTRAVGQAKSQFGQAQVAGKGFFGGVKDGTLQAITAFAGVGSVIGGIASVAATIRSELEALYERQKASADTQATTADAQRAAIGNLGNDPSMNAQQLTESIDKISAETGVTPRDLYNAASSALSARGQLPASAALDAIRVAALNSPGDTGGLAITAGSLLDLQKKSGGTAKANMGQILGAKQAARVETTGAFAKNVIPAVFQLQDFGDTQQQAMGLMATLTQSMGDTEGAMAGTAAIQLAKQLKEALPKMKSTTERIKYLQSGDGKKLRDKLLGNDKKKGTLVGEAKAYTTYQGLLAGDQTNQRELYDTAMQAVPDQSQGEKIFDQVQAQIDQLDIQKTARQKRSGEAAINRMQLADTAGAQAGTAYDQMQTALKQANVGWFDRTAAQANYNLSTGFGVFGDGTQAAADILQQQGARIGTDGTAIDGTNGKALMDLAKQLTDMNAELKKQTAIAEKNQGTEVKVTVEGGAAKAKASTAPPKPRPAEALAAGGGK